MMVFTTLIELLQHFSNQSIRIDRYCSSCWNDLAERVDPEDGVDDPDRLYHVALVDGVDMVIEANQIDVFLYFEDLVNECSNDYDAADDGEVSRCSRFSK